jgi:starch synthase
MKAAIVTADAINTVSPKYAEEILDGEYSHGLHHVLRLYSDKLVGILNGIDYRYYDPADESSVTYRYSWRSPKKKLPNKLSLCEELSLKADESTPIISVVSRLASHKGIDLIRETVYNIVSGNDVRLIILGKGEPQYEDFFSRLEESFPEKVRALITYDRELAKRIYAASDIFLMPSRSEPCGLSQMIASRYGAIPVVRETGGLYDSIKHYSEENGKITGNGITFFDYTPEAFYGAVCRALEVFCNEEKRVKLVSKIMRTDFSWKKSAQRYLELYDVI